MPSHKNIFTSVDDAGLNVGLSFQAYNNLFRGGMYFHLEPVPASAGNWVFKDNLFDHTDFVQDTSQPLDYDYNGYWPLSSEEVGWDRGFDPWYFYIINTNQLSPTATGTDGGHEQVLTTAPPYQAGPFGKFYLPDTTPLYNAGSRSPGDAGLFQYTTQTNQVKEGDEPSGHMVNIGVHYVAATNSQPLGAPEPGEGGSTFNFQPLDTDGDGIPDYVEDANGNGVVDANETDWRTQYTTSGVWDPTNSVYDDIDLSGDGLVGRIKKALGMNPFDTSNPLTATQIVTGEEPEIATFEVPINYDVVTNIGTLRLSVDGSQSGEFQECDRATNGNCLLEWNTTFDSPGQHYFQVQLTLNGNRGSEGATPDPTILTGVGMLGSFNSTNICQFDPFYSEYDDSGATLYAKTPACPDADYTIELQTTSGAHIKTITGSTSSGAINETWDLTDDNGNTVTNEEVNAVFNVTLLDPDFGSLIFPLHHVSSDIWADGNFTVAYAWDNSYEAQYSMHDAIEYGVVDHVISPPESGGSGSFNPYNSTFNDYTWVGDLNGNPGWISSPSVVPALTNNLADPDTRNFYFDGHGSLTSIGNSAAPSDPSSIMITTSEMAALLQNRIGKTSWCRHPYRFVFLNACDTAGGSCWARAFGIKDKITYAQASQIGHAQAFVGWVNESRAPENDDDWYNMEETYAVFYSAWMNEVPLEDCINAASSNSLPLPLGEPFPWYEYAFPSIYHTLPYHIRILGYAGLTRSGFVDGYDNSKYYQQ